MRPAAALVLLATLGCGATPAQSVREPVAAEVVASVERSEPAREEPAWPTEVEAILTSDVPTIAIDVPDTGHVHHCRFRVLERRPIEWHCSPDDWRASLPLDALASERLGALLAAVSDWGRRLTDDEVRPSTLTLQSGRGSRLRFDADPTSEPEPLRTFHAALMTAAQDALARLRSMPEGCSGCREGEYCEEGYVCTTLGPRKGPKNCAVLPRCHARLPATSRCQHDYECQSRRCAGASELLGSCE